MTTGRTIAYNFINKLWQANFTTSEEGAELSSLHCQQCDKNFFTLSEETTMKDIRIATLNHLQQEHTTMWRTLVDAGDACLEAATAAWNAGEDFLSAEALIDSASDPYSHKLIIVCPIDGCGKSFSHKIPPHSQLGPGNLDISDELQHYFISMLAKHYMATHSIADLPIPNTH